MAKPTQPKGPKPRSEDDEGSSNQSSGKFELTGIKLVVVNTVITILICLLFVGSNYFIIKTAMSKISAGSDQSDSASNADSKDEDSGDQQERGVILDLGDFILNLSDPSSRRYLKADVAIELSRTDSDPDPAAAKGGGGEGHGEGAADPAKMFEDEMSQYKPAIRDSVISILSSKTVEELSSISGKELAKEQIKQAVNGIFGGEREVIRVSFGDFIIQ